MKYILLTTALLFAATPVYAGAGHDHGHSHGEHGHAHHEAKALSEAEVITAASDALPQLVEQGHEVGDAPLDAAWKEKAADAKLHEKGNGYYIVSFDGGDEQTLYLLMSDAGETYDANFTGEFEGLKQ